MARAASGGISAIVDAYGAPFAQRDAAGSLSEAQLPPALPETCTSSLGVICCC